MSRHRDIELMAAGWDRRFEADVSRVNELVEMYTEMGYEVTTSEIVPDDFGPDCAGCAIAASCNRYVVIYTRTPIAKVAENAN
ncbi:MAG: hypothetical protein EPN30_08950 [Actinomycetota bacterium]|nr:MAG: hypothetical protein EPN30_08950 [Actinomycetota bacterium]